MFETAQDSVGRCTRRFGRCMGLFSRPAPAQLDIPLEHKEITSRPDTGKLKVAHANKNWEKQPITASAPSSDRSQSSTSSRRRVAFAEPADSVKPASSSCSDSIFDGGSSISATSSQPRTLSSVAASPAGRKSLPSPPPPSPLPPPLPPPPVSSGEFQLNLKKAKNRGPISSLRVKVVDFAFALKRGVFGVPKTGKGSFAEPAGAPLTPSDSGTSGTSARSSDDGDTRQHV